MTKQNEDLWVVYHHKMGAENDDTETDEIEMSMRLIGIYSSEEKASQAMARMRRLPGFRDWPNGFRVYHYDGPLNGVGWTEGFGFDLD
ncbi:hypothetical protein [Roseomonas gilardii]|uniref:hypothetical protein n=1 Tax=Roseomonas gilardii TaxID=257708 RepID=UPI0009DE7D17|nr:hypothetical protein [Roseomonas gilardii]SUE43066.1 Uncharacterised protein [Roseomonas gilardii subsp. rosea]